MIARKNRLTVKRHFKKVYDKGAKYNGEFFICRYYNRRTDTPGRASIVISKKTAPSAVERNLIRRRYKAVLRDGLKVIRGFDLIFIPKKGKKQIFQNIKNDILTCLRKLQQG